MAVGRNPAPYVDLLIRRSMIRSSDPEVWNGRYVPEVWNEFNLCT